MQRGAKGKIRERDLNNERVRVSRRAEQSGVMGLQGRHGEAPCYDTSQKFQKIKRLPYHRI